MAKITFDTIDGGGLAEQFRLALAQIGRNIIDPNMDPKEKRGLVVNLNFIPGETGGINVEYSVKTKLAGCSKGSSLFLIGQDAKSGKIQMTEYDRKNGFTVSDKDGKFSIATIILRERTSTGKVISETPYHKIFNTVTGKRLTQTEI